MFTTTDGYSICYFKNRNEIVVGLPQTFANATSTLFPVVDRKEDPTDDDLLTILAYVRANMNKNTEG